MQFQKRIKRIQPIIYSRSQKPQGPHPPVERPAVGKNKSEQKVVRATHFSYYWCPIFANQDARTMGKRLWGDQLLFAAEISDNISGRL